MAHFKAMPQSNEYDASMELDVLKSMYREHADQARHHESARAQAVNIILVLMIGLTGIAATRTNMDQVSLTMTGWMIALAGVFGAVLCFKYHASASLHDTIAEAYQDYISAHLTDPVAKDLQRLGMTRHRSNRAWSIMSRLSVGHFWGMLTAVVAGFGLIVVLAAAT